MRAHLPPARSATARLSGQQAEYMSGMRHALPPEPHHRKACDMTHSHTDYTSASPSIRRPPRPWAPTSCATISTSTSLFTPGRISLTYTHYDRMIVGGAMPVDGSAGAGDDQADGHARISRPARADRRQYRRAGHASTVGDGTASPSARRDMLYVGMGAEDGVVRLGRCDGAGEILSAQRTGASRPIRPS